MSQVCKRLISLLYYVQETPQTDCICLLFFPFRSIKVETYQGAKKKKNFGALEEILDKIRVLKITAVTFFFERVIFFINI